MIGGGCTWSSMAVISTVDNKERDKIHDFLLGGQDMQRYGYAPLDKIEIKPRQIWLDSDCYGVYTKRLGKKSALDEYAPFGNLENALRQAGFTFDIYEIANDTQSSSHPVTYLVRNEKVLRRWREKPDQKSITLSNKYTRYLKSAIRDHRKNKTSKAR